jgi:hypothetical protein
MYRRSVSDNAARRLLDRLANRIVKILKSSTKPGNSTRPKNGHKAS